MKRFDSAYILAGGQSSRFGENKALVSVLGKPLIVRLASQLASDGLGVTCVVQNLSDYAHLGMPMIEDGVAHGGPLAGVSAALGHANQLGIQWCFISSCDTLNWKTEWRAALLAAIQSRPESLAAVLSDGTEDEFRPFPGLYRSELWELASALWGEGVCSMRKFHQAIGANVEKCWVKPGLLPKSFNTQEELARLLTEKELN